MTSFWALSTISRSETARITSYNVCYTKLLRFDTANVYSDGTSEEIVGRALKDFARRDEFA